MGTTTLTLNQLHKQLGKLIDKGHGRDQVCIDKRTFHHPLEGDGVCILAVGGVEFQHINQVDGDGFCVETKQGKEITRRTVVIHGEMVYGLKPLLAGRRVEEYINTLAKEFPKGVTDGEVKAAVVAVRTYANHLRALTQ